MPTPILTIEQREEVRALYATGDYSQQALAERYGVTQTNISKIVRSPQRVCVDCGAPLLGKRRCSSCLKLQHAAYSLQWAREHKDKVNERQHVRWEANEHYRLRHREVARESAKRRYAEKHGPKKPKRVHTKHVFTMCERPDGTAIIQCVKCGLVYHVAIQSVAQSEESE